MFPLGVASRIDYDTDREYRLQGVAELACLPAQNQVPQHPYSTVHRYPTAASWVSYTINAALSDQQVLVPFPSDRNHLTAVGLVLAPMPGGNP